MAQIGLPPNNRTIKLERYQEGNWEFYWSNEKMMQSKEMDLLVKEIKVSHLPEIFFGYNRLYMVNKGDDFVYEINPLEMINLTSFDERNKMKENDIIYYEPTDVKVQFYSIWNKIKSERQDIKEAEAKSDWSYASSYMGSYGRIKNSSIGFLYGYEKTSSNEKDQVNNIKVERTDMPLPLERLGIDNPIKKYIEINLYDDELNDYGLSEAKIRFRIMQDCFFGLLQSYIRIDNVMIRTIDTRIFHWFNDNYILRSFIVKEASYEYMKDIGFDCSPAWTLSANQSDIFSQKLDETIISVSDKVFINATDNNG